uniref:Uncharacterized protein n=1 Tax=Strigamia maritima TaxID=126957 RepID=T1JLK0_STRMM
MNIINIIKSCIYLPLILLVGSTDGLKRCFECRSRGQLGDCGDPFNTNSTSISASVTVLTCISGWCGKIVDGTEDKIRRTERLCLPQAPSDDEERCGETNWENKKVKMCFCQGDVCNNSSALRSWTLLIFTALLSCVL